MLYRVICLCIQCTQHVHQHKHANTACKCTHNPSTLCTIRRVFVRFARWMRSATLETCVVHLCYKYLQSNSTTAEDQPTQSMRHSCSRRTADLHSGYGKSGRSRFQPFLRAVRPISDEHMLSLRARARAFLNAYTQSIDTHTNTHTFTHTHNRALCTHASS